MVIAGLGPDRRIASSGTAKVMGIEKKVGTVETGKRADLILVQGDPLAHFEDLRKIRRVVIN